MEKRDNVMYFLNPNDLEEMATKQIKNVASLPFIFEHIAIMPDCHSGKGATIGSVIPTKGAIIPAAVGVDIGCGMIAVKTSFKDKHLPDNLRNLRNNIERSVPAGMGHNNKNVSPTADLRIKILNEHIVDHYNEDIDKIDPSWRSQLGTLGGGNHFIEICLDENKTVWVVLHSGSRGVGNKLAMKHIKIAKMLMDKWLIKLPDADLAYLPESTPEFTDYISDLKWAQKFALLNREEMMDRVLDQLSLIFFKEAGHSTEIEVDRINCHHNFAQQENHFGTNVWVTRKGAIQVRKDQRGIIPGSMGTETYIVSGLQNDQAFHSAPHGAGRRLSRTKAKERHTIEDYKKAMEGIECRIDENLIDEIPAAYKNISKVIEYSQPLIKVDTVLKQILNVKGD